MQIVALGQRQRIFVSRLEVVTVLDQAPAKGRHRPVLFDAVAVRNDDRRRQPEPGRGIGDALAVIAAGRGDHSGELRLAAFELVEIDEPAAQFESADRGVVLMLDPQLGANPLRQLPDRPSPALAAVLPGSSSPTLVCRRPACDTATAPGGGGGRVDGGKRTLSKGRGDAAPADGRGGGRAGGARDLQRPGHEEIYRRRNRNRVWRAVDAPRARRQDPGVDLRDLRRRHRPRTRARAASAHGPAPGLERRRVDRGAAPPFGLCRGADHPRGDAAGQPCLCRIPRRTSANGGRLTTHILVVPSWYTSGRGPGGGYFRDQALALAAAGHRVAIAAPAIYTWRDRRAGRAPAAGAEIVVAHDGVPVYRRSAFTALPRLPYRNPLAWAACGLKLAAAYIDGNGRPDLVHAHSCMNAGVVALALFRRYGIPYVVTEHSSGPATGRWWERHLIRRVIARAGKCLAVSPHLPDCWSGHIRVRHGITCRMSSARRFSPHARRRRRRRSGRALYSCASPGCLRKRATRCCSKPSPRRLAATPGRACGWSAMDRCGAISKRSPSAAASPARSNSPAPCRPPGCAPKWSGPTPLFSPAIARRSGSR